MTGGGLDTTIVDVSGFDLNAFLAFVLAAVTVFIAMFALLMLRQVGQMISVLPTTLSPLVRLFTLIYLGACLALIAYFVVLAL